MAGLACKSSAMRYDFFLHASFRHLLHALFSKAEWTSISTGIIDGIKLRADELGD